MNASIDKPINLIVIILGTYLGIKLVMFLLGRKSVRNNSNIYLGIYVLVLLSYFITAFLFRFDLLERFSHVVGVQSAFHFLIGPLAYLYVRACTQKGFELKPLLWLHFLPFGLELIYNMPFFLKSGPEKVAFYHELIQTGKLLSSPYLRIIKGIHGFAYLGLSAILVVQYRKHLSNASSSIDTAYHRWLLFFIFIVALPTLSHFFVVFTEFNLGYTVLVFLVGLFGFFLSLDLATLLKPELFHTFPHQMLIPESTEDKKQKYESSNLQDSQKEKYIEKLQTFMANDKPHLESELTLAQLSEKINIPTHYLSQVINERLKVNFLDFINGYRIKEAQERLLDPKLSHYTILSIAYDAGFNSKSTFYSAFKKGTGMTPSQFRKQKK